MEITLYLHSTPSPPFINDCGQESYLKKQSILGEQQWKW